MNTGACYLRAADGEGVLVPLNTYHGPRCCAGAGSAVWFSFTTIGHEALILWFYFHHWVSRGLHKSYIICTYDHRISIIILSPNVQFFRWKNFWLFTSSTIISGSEPVLCLRSSDHQWRVSWQFEVICNHWLHDQTSSHLCWCYLLNFQPTFLSHTSLIV